MIFSMLLFILLHFSFIYIMNKLSKIFYLKRINKYFAKNIYYIYNYSLSFSKTSFYITSPTIFIELLYFHVLVLTLISLQMNVVILYIQYLCWFGSSFYAKTYVLVILIYPRWHISTEKVSLNNICLKWIYLHC